MCIVVDYAVVRTGLRMVIETKDNIAVVGEAANHVEVFIAARKNPPEIFILDLDLNAGLISTFGSHSH